MKKCVMFGAAGNGERLYSKVCQRYEVIAYTDNNQQKWGGYCNSKEIVPPDDLKKLQYDIVAITSMPGLESIRGQLLSMGLDESIIDDSFVIGPLESRRIFLKDFSSFIFPANACVAEAGVFEGDFAKHINACFANRTLHLFDTFEGFDERDIQKEGSLSKVKAGDYDNTSEAIVMKKMINPKMVKIHKGFFPESARGIDDEFCFVNLDMDLYEPTYQGLEFFAPNMVKNGAILVHDYFSTDFYGPNKAVNEFVDKNSKFSIYPIGDGISILITGF